jgi:hypothetical protein
LRVYSIQQSLCMSPPPPQQSSPANSESSLSFRRAQHISTFERPAVNSLFAGRVLHPTAIGWPALFRIAIVVCILTCLLTATATAQFICKAGDAFPECMTRAITIDIPINIPGREEACTVSVGFCFVSCPPSTCSLDVKTMVFLDADCWAGVTVDGSIYSQIYAEMIKAATLLPGYVPCHVETIPVCPQTTTAFMIRKAGCVGWAYQPLQDRFVFFPCIGSYQCGGEYSICYDTSFSPPKLMLTEYSVLLNVCPSPIQSPIQFPLTLPPGPANSACNADCWSTSP